jgi:hypothetical protein
VGQRRCLEPPFTPIQRRFHPPVSAPGSSEVFPVLLTLKQVDIYLDCNDAIARAKFLRIGVAFWMRQNSERQRRRLAKKEPSY